MNCSDCGARLLDMPYGDVIGYENGRGGYCCEDCWAQTLVISFVPRRRRSIQERFAARRHRKSVLGFWCAVIGALIGAGLGLGSIHLLMWVLS